MWFDDEYDEDGDLYALTRFGIFNAEATVRAALLRQFMQGRTVVREQSDSDDEDRTGESKIELRNKARRAKKTGFLHSMRSTPFHLDLLYNNPKYSDVTLDVGTRSFYAHRVVLSAWSPVFKSNLDVTTIVLPTTSAQCDDTMSNRNNKGYRLTEDPDCCQVFDQFLRFLYSETLTITKDNILPLMKLSKKYEIQEVKQLCDEYLGNLQKDVSSAASILKQVCKFSMYHAMDSCLSTMRTNFELVTADQLQELDASSIVALLSHEQSIVVSNEFAVFEKLSPWLTSCDDDAAFIKVMECIRFIFMTAHQLKRVAESDVMKRLLKHQPSFLVEAVQRHALYWESFFNEILGTVPRPRLYLEKPIGLGNKESKYRDWNGEEFGYFTFDIQNVLTEVKVTEKSQCDAHFYQRDDSARWFVKVVTTCKEETEDSFTWQFEIVISPLHHVRRSGYYDTRTAEIAVQLMFDDGSSHIFSEKGKLVTGDEGSDETNFKFETPPSIVCLPNKCKLRVAVVVHGFISSNEHS